MIHVTLVCMGKLKEAHWQAAAAEYAKRLQAFCKLELHELPPEALPQNPGEKQIQAALQKEADRITQKIPQGSRVLALCIEGRQPTSEQLADTLTQAALHDGGRLTFVIGSSYGLHESVKTAAHACISLSQMTFAHQLARVMLLEQLYRAFTIQQGRTYHK